MTIDYTQATYTICRWRAVFVGDIGHGEYPLIFDLYDSYRRNWLGRALFTRDGEAAVAIDGYDLAPPGPPPRNLRAPRRQELEMRRRCVPKYLFGPHPEKKDETA